MWHGPVLNIALMLLYECAVHSDPYEKL